MADDAAKQLTSRRRFVDWVLSRTLTTWLLSTSIGGLLIAVVYPAGRYLVPPPTSESAVGSVTLPFTPDEIPADSARIFKYGSRPGILVHTSSGEFKAFSATCTHLGCIVQYRSDFGQIWCACHNGHFDLNGINIAGPPPAPLESFVVNVRGDQIVVSKGA